MKVLSLFKRVRIAAFLGSTVLASLVHAQQPGSVDPTFNPQEPGYCSNNGTDGALYSVLVQPDQRIVVGGFFENVFGGLPASNTLQRSGVMRLMQDGSVDTSFHASPTDDWTTVHKLLRRPDGRIVAAGDFSTWRNGLWANMVQLLTDGSVDTSFVTGTGFNGLVRDMAFTSAGRIIAIGAFTAFNGIPCPHIARLNSDGSLDLAFTANCGTGPDVEPVGVAVQADNGVIICGGFDSFNGTARHGIARLNANGSLDANWDPGGVGAGMDAVNAIAVVNDGRIMVSGDFSSMMGAAAQRLCRLYADGTLDPTFDAGAWPWYGNERIVTSGTSAYVRTSFIIDLTQYTGLVRVLEDGSIDPAFEQGGPVSSMHDIALQSDGKPVVVGGFDSYNGRPRGHAVRLQVNGAVDEGFLHNEGVSCSNAYGHVNDLVRLPDDRILVCGEFLGYNGEVVNGLMRIHHNGVRDTTFHPPHDPFYAKAAAVQTDGRVLVGGEFQEFEGAPRGRLIRLLENGSEDGTFAIGTGFSGGAVIDIAVQEDGKIVCAGSMTTFQGTPCGRIMRFLPNGDVDPVFNIGAGPDGIVRTLRIQSDGRILIGGDLTHVDGVARSGIARLNEDGSLDMTFDPGTGCASGSGPRVRSLALLPDGRILIGGSFTTYNGTPRAGIVQVSTDGSLDASFDPGGGTTNVFSIAVENSGRVLIVGAFLNVDGQFAALAARLLPSGELDPQYVTGAGDYSLSTAVVLSNDDALVGGNCHVVHGVGRNGLAMLTGGVSTNMSTHTEQGGLIVHEDGAAVGGFLVRSSMGLKGPVQLVVCDLSGRIVLMVASAVQERGGWRFTLPNAAPGIYTLTATCGAAALHGRFYASGR